MKWFLRLSLSLLAVALVSLLSIGIINRYVHSQAGGKIQTSMTGIPVNEPQRVGVVFGTLVRNNVPSDSLYDRVVTAVELYRAGRIKKMLMSGDRQSDDYDEPAAMKRLAVELGVNENDITLDGDGKRTYDTCYRAREIFGIRQAILVTQDYHLPRAVYLCNNFGIDSIGITANRRTYDAEDYFEIREFFATASAWAEINIYSFDDVAKGAKQPIP